MPGTYNPSDWISLLFKFVQRLRGLETQQQMTVASGSFQPVLNIGQIGNSNQYGFQFIDPATGQERMRLGLLPSGVYGISFSDPSGVTENLFPLYSAYAGGPYNINFTATPVAIPAPSTTAWIGPSGDAFITIASFVVASSANDSEIYLVVDGTPASQGTIKLGAVAAGTLASTIQISKTYVGTVTPNQLHTFSLAGTTNGTACQFQQISIVVQPI